MISVKSFIVLTYVRIIRNRQLYEVDRFTPFVVETVENSLYPVERILRTQTE